MIFELKKEYVKFPHDKGFNEIWNSLDCITRGLLMTLHKQAMSVPSTRSFVRLEAQEVVVNLTLLSQKLRETKRKLRSRLGMLEEYNIIEKVGYLKDRHVMTNDKMSHKMSHAKLPIYRVKTVHTSQRQNENVPSNVLLFNRISKQASETQSSDLDFCKISTQDFLERWKYYYDQNADARSLRQEVKLHHYDLTPGINQTMATVAVKKCFQILNKGFDQPMLACLLKSFFELDTPSVMKAGYKMSYFIKRIDILINQVMSSDKMMGYIQSVRQKENSIQ